MQYKFESALKEAGKIRQEGRNYLVQNGDVIFSSMKEFIENGNPVTDNTLSFEQPYCEVADYQSNSDATEWVIDMIITDNEAASVQKALDYLGCDVSITRQTHWEISVDGDRDAVLKRIDATGELYNSNKEFKLN